jgi:predicted NBD/HSP70 family sugar kinase
MNRTHNGPPVNILNISAKGHETHAERGQLKQLKDIVRRLAKAETPLTIPEIAADVKVSVPTGTKLIRDLLEKKWVLEEGKRETENGRRPELYALNREKFYVVGVEILLKWIHVSVVRIDARVVHQVYNEGFILENTPECLSYITSFIESAIDKSGLGADQFIAIGVGLAGTVNGHTGESTRFFNFMEVSLAKHLENTFSLPVLIDSDTRVIGIAEQVLGEAEGVENVLVVKVSRSLGLSIILNNQIIFGAKGYAGEFGHLQMGTKQRLCVCGKKGCLETEVSGTALLRDLHEALAGGETSLHFRADQMDRYRYHDIFVAALRGDLLSIRLIIEHGDKLGQALGNMANLLNPDLIVIGGEYAKVKDYFIDSVKTGVKKTGLVDSLADCEIKVSSLGGDLGSKAAACMVFKSYQLTKY